MRRQKQVPLSAFVNEKTPINNKKLTVSSKNVTVIDDLPAFVCSQIQILNLPNNRLTSLKGIEQFPFLKQLNISENKIQDGSEICRLKQLFHLQKLYLNNNPFLNEPINEEVLDFILDKETDIEILSFQILSTLKDVQEKQIKIIFLKNYIQKIDMHQQLKNKKKVILQQKTKAQTQQLLNKIVPQFYTLIEDPKIINKIKRQALQKKKRSQQTIEQALEQQKNNKQQKIDQLIKDIVTLLHNQSFKKQQSFLLQVNLNDNTISFSPDRRKQLNPINLSIESQEFSPVKYIQVSKDDASIEDITLTNTKQFLQPTTNTNVRQNIHKNSDPSIPIFRPNSPDNDLDNLETTRKPSTQSISQKIKQHSQFKQSYQSHIKKIKQKQRQTSQSRLVQVKQSSTASKKNEYFKKSSIQSSYIKVIEQNQDQSQQNKSSLQLKQAKNQQQTFKTQKIQSSNISYASNDQITLQAFETIYFKSLSKINPMFHLLYSPSNSLNSQQKNQLLQALKIDHKQRFKQLLKEKQNNQQLMREIDHLRSQLQAVATNNKGVYNQYLVYKQQFQWVDQRQREANRKNQELAKMIKQIETSEKKKTIGMGILENNYKKLKQACSEKHDRINFLENAQHKEQMIRQKRQGNIMKKYLKQLLIRATICTQVNKKAIRNNKNRENQLKRWGMESFKFNRIQSKAIVQHIHKYQLAILKHQFSQWKICKQLQKKEKSLIKNVFKRKSIQFMSLFKKNQAKYKLIKLKGIWANRFFTTKRYKRSINAWKLLRLQSLQKSVKSIEHQKYRAYKVIFNGLRTIMVERKQYIDQISEKRTNRLIQAQFKRMVYIMRKQTIEIEQKYHNARILRERLLKNAYLLNSISRAKSNILLKHKKSKIKKYLVHKNYQVIKTIHRILQKKIRKFGSYCFRLNFGVAIRMMKRQKTSNHFSNVLLKRRWIQFFKNLRQNRNKQINFRKNTQKIHLLIDSKVTFLKLKFIKKLEVYKLKGKNYVQHRKIQEMSYQMDLNDQTVLQLVKVQKEEITRCQRQIIFLKNQIQNQSIRQLSLLREKDDLMVSIAQSYQIMMELRREVDSMRQEYLDQEVKYNSLVAVYNQSITTLQEKEKQYQWLYNTIKSHQNQ